MYPYHIPYHISYILYTIYHISHHIISSHLISSHLISSHIISYHIISYHIISSHHITSQHSTAHHITSHHITSYNESLPIFEIHLNWPWEKIKRKQTEYEQQTTIKYTAHWTPYSITTFEQHLIKYHTFKNASWADEVVSIKCGPKNRASSKISNTVHPEMYSDTVYIDPGQQ